ncbi:ATP-binding protein [Hornefia butyriciproducens]|uniref:ATP-binding protein n=1 Tax=Hornefia butyriciproducens TaxID=2652293 RepID=UPI003F8C0D01
MRLLRCHIENFGGLHDCSLDFHERLTVIDEPNGFGKTTLAEFITAMFYGFPKKKRHKAPDNYRELYTPWQGGVFGGSLEFLYRKQPYRIERSFGVTPREDRFALYSGSTDRRSDDFSENIGTELFGIDADSFRRSTYMPQTAESSAGRGVSGHSPLLTNDIQSKISGLVEDTDDINNYDSAVAKLRELRAGLRPFRGQGGSIAGSQRRLRKLYSEVSVKDSLKNQISRLENEASETNSRLRENLQRRDALEQSAVRRSERVSVRSVRERARDLELVCAEADRQYAHASEILSDDGFPDGAPSEELLQQAETIVRQIDRLNSQLELLEFSPQEQLRYAELSRRFSRPDNHSGHIRTDTPAPGSGSPDGSSAPENRDQSDRQTAASPHRLRRSLSVLPGICAIIGGILLMLLSQHTSHQASLLPGGLLVLAGILAVLFGGIPFVIRRIPRSPHTEAPGPAVEDPALLAEFCELQRRLRLISDPEDGLHSQIDRLSYRLVHQMSPFLDNAEDLSRAVTELRAQKNRSDALADRRRQITGALKKSRDESRQRLEQFRREHQDELSESPCEKNDTPAEIPSERCVSTPQSNPTEAAQLHPAVRPDTTAQLDPTEQLHTLSVRISRDRQRIGEIENTLRTLYRQLDEIPAKTDEISVLTARIREENRQADLLDAAMQFLAEAKDSLSARYSGPILRKLSHYVNRLSEAENRLYLDTDLNVEISRSEQRRSLQYFSAGQKDTVMICLRLALIDSLFRNEKPFLILDDPFVNLDDRHIRKALDLLQTLSSETQIIYMTCSSARRP